MGNCKSNNKSNNKSNKVVKVLTLPNLVTRVKSIETFLEVYPNSYIKKELKEFMTMLVIKVFRTSIKKVNRFEANAKYGFNITIRDCIDDVYMRNVDKNKENIKVMLNRAIYATLIKIECQISVATKKIK